MSSLSLALLSYLLLYKYVFLFGCIFLSAILLPLPDNVLLLAAGAFASQGYLNFWIALSTVLVANVAGDSFDYFFASRYGPAALQKWRSRTPWFITRIEYYVQVHPGVTVFVTRFVGTIDSLVNLLAGLIEMPYRKFLFYDFLGNFISLFAVLYLGYIVGDNWMEISGLVNTVGEVLFVIVVLGILSIILFRQNKQS